MTTELMWIMIFGGLFHFLDALFTILFFRKMSKKYDGVAEQEHNYHRFFMKRFGLVRGSIISFTLSLMAILLILYYEFTYVDAKFSYFLLGMVFMPAWSNYLTWVRYDHVNELVVEK